MSVSHLSTSDVVSVRSMASTVTITIPHVSEAAERERILRRAIDVFSDVEQACTRFNVASPLMLSNASPERWHRVPPILFRALEEAYGAYRRSDGTFDPRVLKDLVSLGYDSSLKFDGNNASSVDRREGVKRPLGEWRPKFQSSRHRVLLREAVDLGGIGKGLAVRWASEVLASQERSYLIDAGGDCFAAGEAPDGGEWSIGVEDPLGAPVPVAVLSLSDRAVATSSVRVRHWRVGNDEVHHLIDPRTGQSGGDGLLAVTVVGTDTALAEVESKVLFLAGRHRIGEVARERGVAAMWCDQGHLEINSTMIPYVKWVRP